MDFTYDEEQEALREAVRGLVGKAYADFENRRRTVADDPGFDEKLWAARRDGRARAAVRRGGRRHGRRPGRGRHRRQELGRVLAPEPFLTSVVLAGGLVAAAGTAEQRPILGGSPRARRAGVRARRARTGWTTGAGGHRDQDGDAWTLSGVKEPVPHGARADLLVVSAALPDAGDRAVPRGRRRAGLTRDGYPTYDGGPCRPGGLRRHPGHPARRAGGDGRRDDRAVLDTDPDRRRQPGARAMGSRSTRPPSYLTAAASSSASRSTPSRR